MDFHLFADDTSIFFSHKNVDKLQEILNQELCNVSDWLRANKLSLNVKKSNILLFRAKNATKENALNVMINNEPLEEKEYTKYLGLYIDNKLTWKFQIEHIKTKLVKGNAILARLRHHTTEKVIRNLYNSFIQPHLDYGALVWGGCAQSHTNTIQVLQNNALRLMTFASNFKDHATPLFRQLNILKIKDNIVKRNKLFIHDYFNKRLPSDFKDFFILDKDQNSYETQDIRPTHIPIKYSNFIFTEANMQPQQNPVHGQIYVPDYKTIFGK